MRKTKIVATVGPACRDEKKLKELLRAGADVVRINASHTSVQGLCEWVVRVRSAASSLKKSVPILVDLQGPRVRTGSLAGKRPLELLEGGLIEIRTTQAAGSEKFIATDCRPFSSMVKKGDPVLLDNGLIRLTALESHEGGVKCRVMAGGILGENKGINLPNAPVTLPALTLKDKMALRAAAEMGVSYVALSFVRSREDVLDVKRYLRRLKREIPVIAKIEKPRAVTFLRDILKESGGIMVARGDLGIEMGVEKVPALQKTLIAESCRAGLPVITATQMLESMMDKVTPSRAEVSDIANAVFDGTDAVMLSGETAVGKYPIEAVSMMARIIKEAEKNLGAWKHAAAMEVMGDFTPETHAISHAAFHAAEEFKAKAVIVFTVSGKSVLLFSRYHSQVPVIALTSSEVECQRLSLLRGVFPMVLDYCKSTDHMVKKADQIILKRGLLRKGDPVILLSGRQALPAARYMTKLHRIDER